MATNNFAGRHARDYSNDLQDEPHLKKQKLSSPSSSNIIMNQSDGTTKDSDEKQCKIAVVRTICIPNDKRVSAITKILCGTNTSSRVGSLNQQFSNQNDRSSNSGRTTSIDSKNTPSFGEQIVVGTECGNVLIFQDYQLKDTIKTKGQAIQHIYCLPNRSNVGDSNLGRGIGHTPDYRDQILVTSDSEGVLTFYSGEQVLSRRILMDRPIKAMDPFTDRSGQLMCVLGGQDGIVVAVRTHDLSWRIRLGNTDVLDSKTNSTVNAILAVSLPDSFGFLTEYVLATTNESLLYFICNGIMGFTLKTPSPIHAMTKGYFLEKTDATENTSRRTQVVMTDYSGNVYLMDCYKVLNFFQLPYAVTKIFPISSSNDKSSATDAILCMTQSNRIYIVHDGKITETYSLNGWPIVSEVIGCAVEHAGCLKLVVVVDTNDRQEIQVIGIQGMQL